MDANLNTIPPPAEMKLSGDVAADWDTLKKDFEDYMLVFGLAKETVEVKAATLRRVMGSECRHYKHNLHLIEGQESDLAAIMAALETFNLQKNVTFEHFVSGSLKQEEGELINI